LNPLYIAIVSHPTSYRTGVDFRLPGVQADPTTPNLWSILNNHPNLTLSRKEPPSSCTLANSAFHSRVSYCTPSNPPNEFVMSRGPTPEILRCLRTMTTRTAKMNSQVTARFETLTISSMDIPNIRTTRKTMSHTWIAPKPSRSCTKTDSFSPRRQLYYH
jgi:hypothetical protein